MSLLLRTWHLANGLKVEIIDDTVNYYSDYSTVKLTIRCVIGVRQEYLLPFRDRPDYGEVADVLSDAAEYRREIVKVGVPGKNLSAVKGFLVGQFEENALGYFERDDFPERFVRKRFTDLAEELSKKSRLPDGSR
jgi:hypothetical protein